MIELARKGEAAWEIGWLVSKQLIQKGELDGFVLRLVSDEADELELTKRNMLRAALHSLEDETKRTSLIKRVLKKTPDRHRVSLLMQAPFDQVTWQFVDECASSECEAYWLDVIPNGRADGTTLQDGVKRLMKAGRPRAAFAYARFQREDLSVRTVFELLSAMAREGGNDRSGEYQLPSYDIAEANTRSIKRRSLNSPTWRF